MKIIITETQYNKAIDRFLTSQLKPDEVIERLSYNKIFWIKDGKIVAELGTQKYDNFFISKKVWELTSSIFSLTYDETKDVIQIWLEKHYNLGELTPMGF
jgi:hypothetical protein